MSPCDDNVLLIGPPTFSVKFPNPLNLSPLLPEAFSVLASFLRQNKRSLKFNTLVLIDTLCKNYSKLTIDACGPFTDFSPFNCRRLHYYGD